MAPFKKSLEEADHLPSKSRWVMPRLSQAESTKAKGRSSANQVNNRFRQGGLKNGSDQ